MFNWLTRKLFLVKEIVSKMGVVHFRRYRLLSTPWLTVYVHRISASDEDAHPHDHPFDFMSLILRGAYEEKLYKMPVWGQPFHVKRFSTGCVLFRNHVDAHKLTLLSPVVWTLVVTGPRYESWGYQTEMGWMDHRTYRQMKNAKTGVDITW